MFQYKAVSNPQSSFWLSSAVVLPGLVVDAAGSSHLKMSTWQLLQVLRGPQRASACRMLGCFRAPSAGRVLHLGEKERSEAAGWALPSPGCSEQFGALPAVLCVQTFAGLREGGVPSAAWCSHWSHWSCQCHLLALHLLPAQFPSEGASLVTTGQGCSAVAAAQLLVKGKSNLLIRLLKSAELASGFLFDLEKMRHCWSSANVSCRMVLYGSW